MAIRLVVGLGNPGSTYTVTRHNAGFWLVDRLATQLVWKFHPSTKFRGEICRFEQANCWLLKPMTFMNRSGQAVAALAQFYKIPVEQILVAHDDLDFPAGVVRLKQGGGDGKHNGLKDIIAQLGSPQFIRLRLGIGHPGKGHDMSRYVLAHPSLDERLAIEQALDATLKVMSLILQGDLSKAMNQLHTN